MKGEYKTKPRNLIMNYLMENTEKRFTARDVYSNLCESGQMINRATVYRNLEKLYQEGKLLRYKENDSNAAYYQYSDKGECNHHMHAQCSECGKIYHLDNEIVGEFEEKLKEAYGIKVDSGKTVLVGKCDNCKQ